MIHFDRISEGMDYANALYEHKDTATPFLRVSFRLDRQWLGSWSSPMARICISPNPTMPSAVSTARWWPSLGAKGEVVTLQRDNLRNLRQLSTVESQDLAV